MKGHGGRMSFTMCKAKLPAYALRSQSAIRAEHDNRNELLRQRPSEKQVLTSRMKPTDWLDYSRIQGDPATFAFLLRLCGNAKALSHGRGVHLLMVETGHQHIDFLGTLLLQMYGKCGVVEDAIACFVNTLERNVLLWNSAIAACVGNKQQNDALQLFEQMQMEGVFPDTVTFISILSACTTEAFLTTGKHIHTLLHSSLLDSDNVARAALINMYGKCCSPGDARGIFDKNPGDSVVIWNSMIAVYLHQGRGKEALQVYAQMLQEGIIPDRVTFASILSACALRGLINDGKCVHAYFTHNGLEANVIVSTAFVNMYCKCGSLKVAREMFDRMPEKNIYSWNAIMAGYAQCGHGREALQLFHHMQQEGLIPDRVSFVSVLSAVGSKAAGVEGRQMHARIVHGGLATDTIVATSLVNMYGKCGNVDAAQEVFGNIHKPNIVSWNAMIAVYAHHGCSKEAFKLYRAMEAGGVAPDKITFINLLDAHSCQESSVDCKFIGTLILHSGFASDIVVSTALLSMYGKSGSLEEAKTVFDNMYERNVVSWNAMIVSYVQHANGNKARQVFDQMQTEGVIPDEVTFVNILNVFSSKAALTHGKWVHACIIYNEFESSIVTVNAIVNMYGKCGSFKDAQLAFNKIPLRNVVSWNAMISAYVQHGQGEEAMRCFHQMQLESVIPDEVTFSCIVNAQASEASLAEGKLMHLRIMRSGFERDIIVATSLVNMYGKCSSMEDAQRMFSKMPVRNVVSWNAMIELYMQHGLIEDAFQLFDQMLVEGVFPDKVTLSSMLIACAGQAAAVKGKTLHIRTMHVGFESDIVVANVIINMYGKCGSLQHAIRMFDKMEEKDAVSWSALITAYAQHGFGRDVLHLFNTMQQGGVNPDSFTFISILSACSHAGLVDEGYHVLVSMNENFGVMPTTKHYDCMIDILGRAGRLNEAEFVIRNMPVQPDSVSWMTLLGSCREQVDVKQGERAAQQAFKLNQGSISPYVMLSNIYAAAVGRNETD